jgi:hypothetical protein
MRTRLIVILIVTSVLAAGPASTRAFAGQQQPGTDLAPQPAQAKPAQGAGTQKPAPQTAKPKPKPTPKLPIGLRVFGVVESEAMAASSTFEAQGGSSWVLGYGGGGEVLNIWQKVFLRAGYSTGSVEGTRGFVIDNEFVSNGIPLKLGVKNFEVAAGWRSYLKKHPRTAWYFAAGLNQATNSQESPDPDSGDNDSKSGTGFVALLGLDFALQGKAKSPLFVGVEGSYRSVGGVLGESGGSEGFNENDLGGYSIRALFGIRFRR